MAGLAAYVEACDARRTSASSAAWSCTARSPALVNRLRVVDHVAAAPGGARPPVEAPVVVVGLFRAGTTLLSNLLDQDPANRALLRWESGDSVPPPSPAEMRAGPRVEAAQAGVDMLEAINPGIRAIHHEDADSPTECIAVLGQAFQSISWEALANVPSYAEWWRGSDMTAGYGYHRDVLQVLQSNGARAGGRSRAPAMPSRSTRSPRSTRTPGSSCCTATRSRWPPRSAASSTRCPRPSATSTTGTTSATTGPPRWRTASPGVDAHADRLHHVQYADLVTDPVGTVAGSTTTWDRRHARRRRRDRTVAARPRGSFGVHRYDLASYGLVEGALRERFAGYVERYDVPREMGTG